MKPKVSDYPTLGHLFFDESIRLDTIIWLAACAASAPKSLTEFLDEEDLETIERTLGLKKEQIEDEPHSRIDSETILSELAHANRQGFLVRVATPIPVAFHENGFSTHGFGYCRNEWFYTDDLRDAAFAQQLLDWKAGVIADERRKLAKKGKKKAISA